MAKENRPTDDAFVCESCGEDIFETEAEECENCSRGCCTLCSPERLCLDCQGYGTMDHCPTVPL